MSSYDPLDIQGQQRAREEQELRERLSRGQEASDVVWLMKSKQGRRVVWRHLERAGVFRSVFSTNAMQMAFNEGHRNYGLVMLDAVNRLAPDAYPVMMAENAPKEEPKA